MSGMSLSSSALPISLGLRGLHPRYCAATITLHGFSDADVFHVLGHTDSRGSQSLKGFGADITRQYGGDPGAGNGFGGLDPGALGPYLAGAVIEVFEFRSRKIDNDKTGRTPEPGIDAIFESWTFTAYGNFIHGQNFLYPE